MEVTRSNFQKVLEELDSVLDDASFFGIDGEFTGLNSGPDASAFDTPDQYYAKLRSGSMDFLLVQFGLSVFTYDSKKNKYLQQSYNFYVFPKPLNRAAPDCRFMCQASSMSFLADQGFDFNKLFAQGIPFLTKSEEEKLSKKIEDRQKAREDNLELIPISEDDRPQIEEICAKIDEFLKSEAEELIVDRCNAFIRRIIHQEARMRWPNKIRLEGKSESSRQFLVVQKTGTKEEEEKKEAERREKEQNGIKQAVGLSALLRKIADSGKLIVGHNMLLDLCHIVHQFFAPLPESYHEFKSLIHCLFPKLLDTKVMCQSPQFRESIPCSILNALHETVSKPPYCVPEMDVVTDRSYSTSVDKSHEAGYDAYITGLCFISLSNYLGSLQKPEVSTVLPKSPLLNPFLNKLLISRLKDFPYIDLMGKDPNPSREHVFHITFPKEWKLSDISQLFSQFGGVYVSWLSDTTAYIGLNRRDQAAAVNKHNFTIQNFRIQKYADYQTAVEARANSTTVSVQGDRKRKLSSSDNTSPVKERNKKSEVNGEEDGGGSVDDQGWEMASGNDSINVVSSMNNDLKFLKKHCYKNYEEVGSVDFGKNIMTDNIAKSKDRIKSDNIKPLQKVRLKNTYSLPNDIRACGLANKDKDNKKEIPRYTILRRTPDQIDIKNIIENSQVLRPYVKELIISDDDLIIGKNCGNAQNFVTLNTAKLTDDKTEDEIVIVKNGKPNGLKKPSLGRAKSNPITDDGLKIVRDKFQNVATNNSSTAQKKFNKTTPGSTPSASPKAVKTLQNKKSAKQKPSDFSTISNFLNVAEKISVPAVAGVDGERQFAISDKLKNFDKTTNERLTATATTTTATTTTTTTIGNSVADSKIKEESTILKNRNQISSVSLLSSEDKVIELKKPTMKLLRGARKRSENVILTGSMIYRVIQVVGVLLIIYVITIF